jgi:hypothetical protein
MQRLRACVRCGPPEASSCHPSRAPASPGAPRQVSRPVNSTNSGVGETHASAPDAALRASAQAPPRSSASAASRTRSARRSVAAPAGVAHTRVSTLGRRDSCPKRLAVQIGREPDQQAGCQTHRERPAAAATDRAQHAPAAATSMRQRRGDSRASAASVRSRSAARTPYAEGSRAARARQAAQRCQRHACAEWPRACAHSAAACALRCAAAMRTRSSRRVEERKRGMGIGC